MEITREDQKRFAREVLSISDRDSSPEIIKSLRVITSLFISWTGEDKDIAIDLSEYIGELELTINGGEDTGWKDEFKRVLLEDLEG